MRKKTNKLLICTLLGLCISFVGCTNEDIKKNYQDINLNDDNAKAIRIDKKDITNISSEENENITTKITNISDFYINNVWIGYEELSKGNKLISTSQIMLDMTLLPGETSSISFANKNDLDTIHIISYGYEAGNKDVFIDLKKNTIKIIENKNEVVDSDEYEVLAMSDISKVSSTKDINKYKLKIKNLSKNDLGNVAIKIGEMKDGEYMYINHLSPYSVLKVNQEIELDITSSKDVEQLKVLGYSYDDMLQKANIDIDLKSHKAIIKK